MTEETWHLKAAMDTLDKWYQEAEGFIKQREFFLNLVVPCYNAANDVQRKALHCKTAGLVWHDRFKMVLDTRRNFK